MAIFNLSAELKMYKASITEHANASAAVKASRDAANLFPMDHNLRRMPAALAAGMSSMIPTSEVASELAASLKNDPHARDLQMQLKEAQDHLRAGGKLQ